MKAALPRIHPSHGRWPIAVLLALVTVSTFAAEGPSFRRDVMAVLSKAGCNAGVCHGNLNGKGGFRLSLRGQDPDLDYLSLTRDQFGRRLDLSNPAESLLLRKPTMQTAHEGGRRFAVGSPEYDLLCNWIAAGASDDPGAPVVRRLVVSPADVVLLDPAGSLQLVVQAELSDGATRDVTRWAVYEPSNSHVAISIAGAARRESFGESTVLVRYLNAQSAVRVAFARGPEISVERFPAPVNYIDERVFARLRQLRIAPSPIASDAAFLRRACLDLIGRLPTAELARSFTANASPAKRADLVEELLARPEFAAHWALKWCDLLRVEEKVLDRKGTSQLHHWLVNAIDRDLPLDMLARQLVTAQGSTYQNPPANFYRALRDPISRAESVAQVFLGVRLQCAKCHNHPFDRWSQDDYYDWAAVFSDVQYKILANDRRDQNDKHEFDGEQIVYCRSSQPVQNPRTGDAAAPRLLGNSDVCRAAGAERLEALAAWLTAKDNPLFAQAQVNRVWAALLGRGLIDPVDDVRANNPPSHPQLLADLTRDFVEHGYSLRHIIRRIASSATYQLSSQANDTNAGDESHFARARVVRLSAEQLLDAVSQALDAPAKFNGYPSGMSALEVAGVQAMRPRDQRPAPADAFLLLFGKPPRLLSCDCERSNDVTLGQTFALTSGDWISEMLAQPDNRLGSLLRSDQPDEAILAQLYWTTLSRPPGDEELTSQLAHLRQSADRRAALEDVAWALLNSAEFLLRH